MNVQCFIPDWPGPKQHAKQLAVQIRPYCPVTILDDPDDYFNAQFEKARQRFTGDVMLWVMADVTLPEDFGSMFQEMIRMLSRPDVGWYAPDIDWTSYIYHKHRLRQVEEGIYEVPNTDSLCIGIRRDLLDRVPHVDPKVSYMWGMDIAALATARQMGLKTVRDYRFKAKHPNHTGYEIERAGREMIPLFNSFSPQLKTEIHKLETEVRDLRVNFWHEKRILIPGGAGFLGSHVIDYLKQFRGVEPKNIFVPRLEDHDLRVSVMAERLLNETNPDIIINLAAAVGGLGANLSTPASFFYDNMMIGLNLLEEARHHNIQKFVQMGSACEYPKNAPMPLKEETVWDGYPEDTNAAYGIAKRALLTAGQAYRQQHGMNVIHILSTNLYGPRDNFSHSTSHVIPALIQTCIDGPDIPILDAWGTGAATRDFLYVKDAAEGIVMATEYYNNPRPVNLGSGHEFSIKELVSMVTELTGYTGQVKWHPDRPEGQPRRVLDTSRAKSFGFVAQTPLKQGLKETIEWYRNGR